MIPEKEVRICDLCGEYYPVVIENPDYKFTYLNKQLDLCNNCYNDVIRCMENKKKPKPPFLTRSDLKNTSKDLGYVDPANDR